MPDASKQTKTRTRTEARRIFEAHLAQFGNYWAAAAAAGVSDRTGRRWRADFTGKEAASGTPCTKFARFPTSFVGRASAVRAVEAALSQHALVTVRGCPGIGKTRVADRILQQGLRRGEPGAFCDLRQASDDRALCKEVARTLGLRDVSAGARSTSVATAVGRGLRSRGPLLLVLDNMEQLDEVGSRTVAQWRDQAPETRFLVTSRRPLRVIGEVVYELGPLACDGPEAGGSLSEAEQLFVERVRCLEPKFDPRPPEAGHITALVKRLEGIPLALELAAAQAANVGTRELLERLPAGLAESEAPVFDRDLRHQTLRSAIHSSWHLLSSEEQTVLAQLSVFRKGFDLEAAESVATLDNGAAGNHIGRAVGSLRQASLLRLASEADPSGAKRWDLFEAIREHAAEQLVALDGEAAARSRHAHYFLLWGERWVASLIGDEGAVARHKLTYEFPNLEVAFETFARKGSPAALVRMALVLYEAARRATPGLCLEPLSLALERAAEDPAVPRDDRVRLYIARGVAHRDVDDNPRALSDFSEARALLMPGSRLSAEVDYQEGALFVWKGDFSSARLRLERALAVARSHRAAHLEARIRRYLGRMLAEAFQDTKAFEHYAESVALFDRVHDRCEASVARKMWCVHRVFFQRGDPGPELERELVVLAELGDHVNEAAGYTGLGLYHHERGELEVARTWYERASALARRLGLHRVDGVACLRIGICLQEQGLLDDSMLYYRRSIEKLRSAQNDRYVALARIYLAGLVAIDGDPDEAAASLDAIEKAIGTMERGGLDGLPELQRCQVDLARSAKARLLGQSEVARSYRESACRRLQRATEPRREMANRIALPLQRCNPEARLITRLAEAQLALPFGDRAELLIWKDGSTFQLGAGGPVDVPDGFVIRSLLTLLGRCRVEHPGREVDPDTILASCWPGERVLPASASKRVRETVRRLRRLGLESVVITRPPGYLIDESVDVRLVGDHGSRARHV